MDWTPFEIGIGIHTGTAIVGNLGSERKMEFTAIGETINVAARLVEFSKKFCNAIVVSEPVATFAQSLYELDHLGAHPIRGLGRQMHLSRLKRRKIVFHPQFDPTERRAA